MKSPWFVGDFPITQGYKPGPGTFDPTHTGIDIGMPKGTPLVIPFDGVVTNRENPGGYGHYQTVIPDDAPRDTFILGHESLWNVKSGHHPAGTHVGLSGATGHATGPHLHFEEDHGGPPYAAGNETNPSAALKGTLPNEQVGALADKSTAKTTVSNPYQIWDPRWAIWEAQHAGDVIGSQVAALNPFAAPIEWLQSVFSHDHLFRFVLGSMGFALIIIGFVVLTKAAEKTLVIAGGATNAATGGVSGAVADGASTATGADATTA